MSPDQEAAVSDEKLEGYAKYRHLRANVRRRRGWYMAFVFIALLLVGLAVADIGFLRSDPVASDERMIEFAIYGLLAFFLLVAFLMLFSRSRAEEVTEAQAQASGELEHVLLECPDCRNVFEYAQPNLAGHKEISFSCPVCGVFSKLPSLNVEPVKVLNPEGDYKELRYRDAKTGDEIAVGTYGQTPLNLVRFRASPVTGEKGVIERVQTPPPADFFPPEPTQEEALAQQRPPLVRRGPLAGQPAVTDDGFQSV